MLTAKEQSIDLGTLRFGKPHKFDFEVTNTSNSPIEIIRLQIGCSACTTATLSKNKVAPGESALIHVTFTPGSTGVNNKSISVV